MPHAQNDYTIFKKAICYDNWNKWHNRIHILVLYVLQSNSVNQLMQNLGYN